MPKDVFRHPQAALLLNKASGVKRNDRDKNAEDKEQFSDMSDSALKARSQGIDHEIETASGELADPKTDRATLNATRE